MSKEEFFRTEYFRRLPEDRQSFLRSMIKNADEIKIIKGRFNNLYGIRNRRRERFVCL